MILGLLSGDSAIGTNAAAPTPIPEPVCECQTDGETKTGKDQPNCDAYEDLGPKLGESEFRHGRSRYSLEIRKLSNAAVERPPGFLNFRRIADWRSAPTACYPPRWSMVDPFDSYLMQNVRVTQIFERLPNVKI